MPAEYRSERHEMAQVRGRTIFAPVSKEDPKHGRWILPLVVLLLVVFTYTFVNNLPEAEIPITTTSSAADRTTTTESPPETTTTTLAPEVLAFAATVDALAAEAEELRTEADTINTDYPDTTGYGPTRDALSTLRQKTKDFSDRVSEFLINEEVPESAEEQWGDVTTSAAAMQSAADDMFDGLTNTSGSEKRLAALEEYNIAAGTFAQHLEDAKAAAMEPPDSE